MPLITEMLFMIGHYREFFIWEGLLGIAIPVQLRIFFFFLSFGNILNNTLSIPPTFILGASSSHPLPRMRSTRFLDKCSRLSCMRKTRYLAMDNEAPQVELNLEFVNKLHSYSARNNSWNKWPLNTHIYTHDCSYLLTWLNIQHVQNNFLSFIFLLVIPISFKKERKKERRIISIKIDY